MPWESWGHCSNSAGFSKSERSASLAMVGRGDDTVQLVPHGVELTDEAIAELLSWALLEDLDE